MFGAVLTAVISSPPAKSPDGEGFCVVDMSLNTVHAGDANAKEQQRQGDSSRRRRRHRYRRNKYALVSCVGGTPPPSGLEITAARRAFLGIHIARRDAVDRRTPMSAVGRSSGVQGRGVARPARHEIAVLRRINPRSQLDWADRAVLAALILWGYRYDRRPRCVARPSPAALVSRDPEDVDRLILGLAPAVLVWFRLVRDHHDLVPRDP